MLTPLGREVRSSIALAAGILAASALVFAPAWAFAQQPEPAVVPVPDTPPPKPVAKPKPERVAQDEEPEVLVLLKDGRQFTGYLLRSKPDVLSIRVGGVPLTFESAEIEKYQVLPPLLERYRELKAAAGDDPDMLLQIARWLHSRERFELALTEVQRVLTLEATNADAKRLKLVLEEQILLKARAIKPAATGEPDDKPESTKSERPKDFPTLSPAQINLIKVYELDLADNPRFTIPRESILRMLDANAASPLVPSTPEGREALLRRPASEILSLMFDLRARDFYADVNVLDQPRSIQMFRDSVARTWLNNSCATTQCHGGTDAGRLVLINRRQTADPAMYTNLLVLFRYKTDKGQPLINWEAPERSVLLQMGLPRDKAIVPHPEVPQGVGDHDAWKPVFRSRGDAMFKAGVEWIKHMRQPRIEWPVDYAPFRPLEPETPAPRTKKPQPPTTGGPPKEKPASPEPPKR